jgi:hypothetical protein
LLGVLDTRASTAPGEQLQQALLALCMLVLWGGGILVLLSTMRARNGYRGLHEWVSGTRVIRLPDPEARRSLGRGCAEWTVSATDGWPSHLGSFAVAGAIRAADREVLLLGEDPGLHRKVFLWLRPAEHGAAVPRERRELSRATRPRWLARGQHGDQVWDAFLAPHGHPLPDVIGSDVPLSWADTRYLLTQLADELAASGADGTMPLALTVCQVWVQSDGRVQLVDMPRFDEQAEDALGLLRDVATLCLEGRPRPPKSATPAIRAPVPRYAADLLDRLVDPGDSYRNVRHFQRYLKATADKPGAVTRDRRLAHAALLAALLSLGLAAGLVPMLIHGFFPFFMQSTSLQADEQKQGDLRFLAIQDAVATLQTDPWARCLALQQLKDDLHLREQVIVHLEQRRLLLDERRRSLSRIGNWVVAMAEGQMAEAQKKARASHPRNPPPAQTIRAQVGRLLTQNENVVMGELNSRVRLGFLLFALAWPVAWIVWAFLWRGGLSFYLLGLALVRWDGRPAGRWQCAWRAFLFWAPVTALIALSLWLDGIYWSKWSPDGSELWLAWLSWLTWWGGLVLLFPGYFILALRSPARSMHDRLAGTYLVPR